MRALARRATIGVTVAGVGLAMAATPAGAAVAPSWGPPVVTSVGYFPTELAVADFNGDGRPDVVTNNQYDGTVSVLLNNGTGGFTRHDIGPWPLLYVPSGTPIITAVAAGDLNGDGNIDIAATTFEGEYVAVLLGNGDGTFQPMQPVHVQPGGQAFPSGLAIGDMTGDGIPDLVITRELNNAVQVLVGNGDGTFTLGQRQSTGGQDPTHVELADLNGDGALDAVAMNNTSATVGVLIGDGHGGFSGTTTYPAPGITGNNPSPGDNPLAIGDIDGDGHPDIVVPANHRTSPASATVLHGDGQGGFTESTIPLPGNAWGVAIADLNGDGIADLAFSSWGYATTVLTGTGGGAFADPVLVGQGRIAMGIAVADIDGDGRSDLVEANPFSNSVSWLPNDTSVPDTTPPTLAAHPDLTAEATGPGGATVTYALPVATDRVDPNPTVNCTPAPGSQFPLGDTTVSCTATDASGNVSAPQTFGVHVVDTTPPTVTVPGPVTVDQDRPAGAVVTFSATATDLVDGSLTPSCDHPSGATFPAGTTTVTCTATDAHGNTGAASFTVTVRSAADQLDALQSLVAGVGPGKSLQQKIADAQRGWATGDAAGAAATLNAFIAEVRAQSGKKYFDVATGQRFIAAAQQIRAALGYGSSPA